MTHHNLGPEEYREKWDLPMDYPMVAPAYAEARSRLAKEMGLGQHYRKRDEVIAEPGAGQGRASILKEPGVRARFCCALSEGEGRRDRPALPASAAPQTPAADPQACGLSARGAHCRLAGRRTAGPGIAATAAMLSRMI